MCTCRGSWENRVQPTGTQAESRGRREEASMKHRASSRSCRRHRRQRSPRVSGPMLLTAAATSVVIFATVGTMSAMGVPGAHRAATSASAASPAATGRNLVRNGTFEKNVAGWTTSNHAELARSLPGRGSSGSARLSSLTESTVVLNDQTNTVRAAAKGKTVKASAWVRGLRPGLSGALRLTEVVHNVRGASDKTTFRLAGTDWTMVSLTYTVKHPGAALDLNVLGSQVGRGQALIVDDVQLVAAANRSLLGLPTASVPVPLPTIGLPSQQPGPPTATSGPGTPTPTSRPTTSQSTSATPKPTPTTTSPTATSTPKPSSPAGGCTARFPGDPCAGKLYYGASVEGGDPSSLESQTGTKLSLYRSYM